MPVRAVTTGPPAPPVTSRPKPSSFAGRSSLGAPELEDELLELELEELLEELLELELLLEDEELEDDESPSGAAPQAISDAART